MFGAAPESTFDGNALGAPVFGASANDGVFGRALGAPAAGATPMRDPRFGAASTATMGTSHPLEQQPPSNASDAEIGGWFRAGQPAAAANGVTASDDAASDAQPQQPPSNASDAEIGGWFRAVPQPLPDQKENGKAKAKRQKKEAENRVDIKQAMLMLVEYRHLQRGYASSLCFTGIFMLLSFAIFRYTDLVLQSGQGQMVTKLKPATLEEAYTKGTKSTYWSTVIDDMIPLVDDIDKLFGEEFTKSTAGEHLRGYAFNQGQVIGGMAMTVTQKKIEACDFKYFTAFDTAEWQTQACYRQTTKTIDGEYPLADPTPFLELANGLKIPFDYANNGYTVFFSSALDRGSLAAQISALKSGNFISEAVCTIKLATWLFFQSSGNMLVMASEVIDEGTGELRPKPYYPSFGSKLVQVSMLSAPFKSYDPSDVAMISAALALWAVLFGRFLYELIKQRQGTMHRQVIVRWPT